MSGWERAYREAPEIVDAFCRAEDPDGLIAGRILALAGVDGRDVLEIGCGTGRYTRQWAPRAALYLAVERSPRMLELARRLTPAGGPSPGWICGDARALPLDDGSVDVTIAGWVLVNMRHAAREAVMGETARVLRRGAGRGNWLVENHDDGEFQLLRGSRVDVERRRIRDLTERHGYRVIDVVHSALSFPDAAEAERVLGFLCGAEVALQLARRPRARLGHHVVILHRPAPPAA